MKKAELNAFLPLFESNSLLSYIKNKATREEILTQASIVVLEDQQTICIEGEPAEDLVILLEGGFELYVGKNNSDTIQNGTLVPGRSINLYSLLRGLPFQYSVKCREKTIVLKISWDKIKPYLSKVNGLIQYLLLITENGVVRKLAKEMDTIGINSEFKAFLLGSLQVTQIPPQKIILSQNNIPRFAFIIQEGTVNAFHNREDSNFSSIWHPKCSSYIGFHDCLEGKPSPATYRSVSNAQILTLNKESILKAKELFPEDFSRFYQWFSKIHSLELNENTPEDETEIDLNEIFADDRETKKKRYMLKYPFVQQHDEMDCGPACLAMISKYYKSDLSIQFWRQKLHTNQLGTTLFDLASTAETYGFRTHPVGVEDITVIDKTHLPIIVLRKYHYVVVYEISATHVVVGDPSIGIIKLTLDDFHNGFEQAVLLLTPNEHLNQNVQSKSKYTHFFKLISGFRREMIVIILASIAAVGFAMAMPLLLQVTFDSVLNKKDFALLTLVLLAGFISIICQGILNYIRANYLTYISSKFDFIASSAFFKKLFSLPYDFISSRHVGDFTHRLYEMERLREFLTTNVVHIMLDLVTVGFFALVMFLYSPVILGVTLLFCFLLVGVTLFFSSRLNRQYCATFTQRSEQESLVTDMIKGVQTIKSLNCEITSRWKIEEKIIKTLKSRHAFLSSSNLLFNITDTIDQSAKLAVVGLAAYLALKGQLSAGQVISISVLVRNLIEPFNGLAHSWAGIQEAKSIANRLNDVFLAESEKGTKLSEGLFKNELNGEIEFQNVWFRYGGEANPWALQDVSFSIHPGQSAAIVGPSGSGKTTIGQLLAGLYRPTKGRILIDGRDIYDYHPGWLRKKMGFILQEPSLFYGTIAENISLGSPEMSMSRIEEVSQLANAEQFILEKPNGYNYVIARGGLGLSAGEKQRIAFARSLYNDPKILILDEATSAMDGISERSVMNALRGHNRTLINIAHRFSTARTSDFIIVMSSGVVAELGSHDYLTHHCELYRKLFNLDSVRKKAS